MSTPTPTASHAAVHEAVRATGGFFRADDRGIVRLEGRDAASFLHNLTTNTVTTLQPGDGNYAFAINLQGRALFDMNILVLEDAILLDLDRAWVVDATAHLSKYLVVEDVRIVDESATWTRFVVLGPATARVVERLGLGRNFDALADVQHQSGTVAGQSVRLVKNNLGPVPRGDLWTPSTNADAVGASLADAAAAEQVISIDPAVHEVIRVEVGVPASCRDIDDQVIPPETRQIERGISYVKGCYLGQEVIERMRSRNSMSRQLVGLHLEGTRRPEPGAPIFAGGKEVGRVTSTVQSIALDGILALGYVKVVLLAAGSALQVAVNADDTIGASLVELPLSAWRG